MDNNTNKQTNKKHKETHTHRHTKQVIKWISFHFFFSFQWIGRTWSLFFFIWILLRNRNTQSKHATWDIYSKKCCLLNFYVIDRMMIILISLITLWPLPCYYSIYGHKSILLLFFWYNHSSLPLAFNVYKNI